MRLPTWISSPFGKRPWSSPRPSSLCCSSRLPPSHGNVCPRMGWKETVFCGARPARDRAIDLFCEEAGQEKASLTILIGDRPNRDAADKLATALKAHKPASVVVLDADTKAPKMLEALRGATGVWVLGGADSAADKELPAAMKRGVVAASGSATKDVSDLLPGAVIDPDFAGGGPEKLFAALDKSPGAFGIGLGEGTAPGGPRPGDERGRRRRRDGPSGQIVHEAPARPGNHGESAVRLHDAEAGSHCPRRRPIPAEGSDGRRRCRRARWSSSAAAACRRT